MTRFCSCFCLKRGKNIAVSPPLLVPEQRLETLIALRLRLSGEKPIKERESSLREDGCVSLYLASQ